MEDFEEFRKSIVPSHKGQKFKVTGSWGVYDAYKYIRKHGWFNIGHPVTEKDFYATIRGIHKLLAEQLAKGETVTFPWRMGQLEIRRSHRGVSIVGGQLKITYPVDWINTLHLWHTDAEAFRNKTLLRHENEWIYRIKYIKDKANYDNKLFYQFDVNTFIKRALKENIKQGKVNTLW